MSQLVNGEDQAVSRAARSVSVLGQQGVVCSPTTMLAILDHSLAGVVVKRLPVQSIPVLDWLQNPVPTMSPLFKVARQTTATTHQQLLDPSQRRLRSQFS